MSTEREDTFLLAVTVAGASSRAKARMLAYSLMPLGQRVMGSDGVIESWSDATVDHVDNNDDGEAVTVHPGRGIEAQRALVAMGYAPETDMAIGPHPGVWVIRNGEDPNGDVLCYECVRCNNGSDHPAVLAEVPCVDLARWEHAHLWVDDNGILDGNSDVITCLSDCGMTIVDGKAVGEVSDEFAGYVPE